MEIGLSVPELLASTGSKFSCFVSESKNQDRPVEGNPVRTGLETNKNIDDETNYFKSIQWSPDGTSLFTNSADNILRTFIGPADLLSPHASPLALTPYSSQPSPEPIYALTPYPFFSLQDQSTTLLLSSPRDLPIRLSNALYPSLLATYPLISPTTEAFLTPSSLIWTPDGTHFLAGTESLVTLFDISRLGEGPVTRLPTIPSKRHKMKGGGVGMRGIVSCLSLQPLSSPSSHSDASSLLAAGTWTRWVSLYDAAGLGGTVANWSIASAADSDAKISGGGVSQVLWSPCGRYLFVVERKSRGVLIYDVRVTGRLVGWLKGRAAETNQRLGVEIFSGGNAESESVAEVWAGDTDGLVKVWNWRGIGEEDGKEGEGMSPTSEWNSHGSAVTGVAVHPSGVVVATSSGQRQDIGSFYEEETDSWDDNESYDSDEAEGDDDESFITAQSTTSSRTSKRLRKPPDNSIKIWRL